MSSPIPRDSFHLAAALAALLLAPAWASAATILVTTTADDVTPNGTCSLREAIQAANGDVAVDACPAGSGADVIRLDNGVYRLTIPGANEDAALTGDLDITDDLTILGAGTQLSVIDAGASLGILDRVLDVHPATVVMARDLTVQGGDLRGPGHSHGGGMRSRESTLTLTRVAISGNSAAGEYVSQPPPGVQWEGRGGGLSIEGGAVELRSSTVSENRAAGGSAYLGNPGCGYGGGIDVQSGTLDAIDSSIGENDAVGGGYILGNTGSYGGGLSVGSAGSASFVRSTIARNSAVEGAGAYNLGFLELDSSTVGEGELGFTCDLSICFIYPYPCCNEGHAGTVENRGNAVVRTSTLGPVSGATEPNPVANVTASPGTTTLSNSIVTGACTGSAVSAGYNLVEVGNCVSPAATDITGVPVLIDTLQYHGGTAETYRPLVGSPAIDSGDPDACPEHDQRGAPRPLDGDDDGIARCDRGAVEASCAGPDADQDTLADTCDPCPADPANDADHDGVCESEDVCLAVPDPDQSDRDGDHFGDACDLCTDADHDGYGDPASHSCSHDEVDCDDSRAAVNPGQTEVWQNGLDDDCNPITSDTGCVPEPANAATGGAASRAGPSPSTILGWLVLALGLRTLRRARHPALRSR